ncbi:SCO6745 family protein [Streptomyces sp. NPDC002248]
MTTRPHTTKDDLPPEPARVRQLWHLLEPLHAVVYYAPESYAEAGALGLGTDERWPLYFAWRAAPLGAVSPAVLSAVFHSFEPGMVERYATGTDVTPEEALAGRLRAVDRTWRALLGDAVDSADLAEAARLARTAAQAAVTTTHGAAAGRPLAAANGALPWPEAPHLQLWQAATILREHRGDGHVAALVAAGLDGIEALVTFASIGAAPRAVFASRGWSESAWQEATTRLRDRGLVTSDGTATDQGRALRAEIEHRTDTLAAAPWQALGTAATTRLTDLLATPWLTMIGSGLLPTENTLGIGKV